MAYWLDLFTGETWDEFIRHGGMVSGFRESRWKGMQRIKIGDFLLCYITGISRFIGVLKVTSAPYKSKEKIWERELFPCRVNVEIVYELSLGNAVPIHDLKGKLSFYKEDTIAWTGYVRGSPALWKEEDARVIIDSFISAKKNPIEKPYDKKKLARRPKGFKSPIGSVSIPEKENKNELSLDNKDSEVFNGYSDHIEIQYLLLKLGSDMSFSVWVAKNDKNKQYNRISFLEIPGMLKELPLQFDEATNRTIQLIDVLWIKGNAIIAAFEIESTTSIYSGLLRMSDLITMQPNINIPLYIVAPSERRMKVITEINRPTFSKSKPPMYEMCRYISFETLRKGIDKNREIIKYLKPEYLEEISESCEIEDA